MTRKAGACVSLIEAGGSSLRHSFDIKSADGTREVGVDAKTGKLLENSVEGVDND